MNKSKFENINQDEFTPHLINVDLVKNLIADQFPEYAHLTIASVEKQGHDNRTFRLGDDMLVRIPSAKYYALKVPKEQEFLPLLKPYLTVDIPVPVKMGNPSSYYPFNFSIYKWLEGTSANYLKFDDKSCPTSSNLPFQTGLKKVVQDFRHRYRVPIYLSYKCVSKLDYLLFLY